MKITTECVVDDEIRMDIMGEGVVSAIVNWIKNEGKLMGGEMDGVHPNGEVSFCRIKLKDAKKKVE